MAIEVECRGCHARYRVKDELAGRTAECKHCGQKFRVPYRSAVVKLGDEDEAAAPPEPRAPRASSTKPVQTKPAEDKGSRSFAEYGVDPNDPTAPVIKRPKERKKVAQGILPELVADLWLPLGLMIVCYGLSLFIAVSAMLRSNGPLAGMILLAIVTAMFFALVIPMTMRMIEGASKTLDFEPPNAIWLQTAGLIGLPTAGLVIGLFGGGIAGMIAGSLVGFALMVPLLALMFRIDMLKGLQAAVLAIMFYALSLGITGGVVAAVGLWLMPLWKLTTPWQDKPAEVAAAVAPAPAAVTDTKPTEAAPAPAAVAAVTPETDKAPETVAPTGPVKPVDPWEVVTDAWSPGRWPRDVHHVLNVRPPVKMLETASAHDVYTAVVDQEGVKVFDLRTGKRVGMVPERPRNNAAAISKDGAFVAFEVAMTTGAVPPSIEVWSVVDGKMHVRIPAQGNVRALGFDPSGRVYVINAENGKRVVQGWDVRTRRQVSSTALDVDGAMALSPNARLLAIVRPGELRVYDLTEAKLAGRKPIELGFDRVGPVAFSPDGTRLAAAVSPQGPTGSPRVLLWSLKDGEMDAPIVASAGGATASSDVSRMDLMWLGDSDGLLVNGEMIDRATGKPIYKPQPPAIGNVVGKVRLALSPFRLLYEIPPAGGADRLVYRFASLPRAELIGFIKAVRGPEWNPAAETEPGPALAAATEDGDATTRPSAAAVASAAPATRPTNPAMMKEWVVSVLAVAAPDGPSIERQLRAEQLKLGPLQSTYNAAEQRADQMAGDYTMVSDGVGGRRRQNRYGPREIGQAKAAAKKAQEELRDVKSSIARLERELKGVTTVRTVTGTLDGVGDGTIPVTIAVDGASLVTQVDSLTSGAKVRVTGAPRYMNGTLEIKLRTVTAAE